MQNVNPGVIWISGFSAAGKTSIARNLVSRLRADGLKVIHLDGDDLRAIFGNKFGFDRPDRIELARSYFRLCSYLAAQDNTVVISAVAMYQEVREWIRTYIPKTLEVYLRVNNIERQRRDLNLKNIYQSNINIESLYDLPDDSTFTINNQGDRSIDSVAQEIYDHYTKLGDPSLDLGRGSHWKKFYADSSIPTDPSPFALDVFAQLEGSEKILEIGCGNGRDAEYFGKKEFSVVAVDSSHEAINKCKSYDRKSKVKYFHSSENLPLYFSKFDVAYCRFVIHAMPLSDELVLHRNVFNSLNSGGKYFIECRSVNDPMAYIGEIISSSERVAGHYRRFIVQSDLIMRLEDAGFAIETAFESKGLAVFGKEDPMVIRIKALKK